MNTKPLNNWFGSIAIAWMLAGYAFLSSHNVGFNPLWLSLIVVFLGWLGVGLGLALAGLLRGNLVGRICATAALVVFSYFAWHMVSAALARGHQG